jgi:hypothetical protein
MARGGVQTGHLTSRPHLKRAIRTVDARLHAADALYALSSPVHAAVPSSVRAAVYADLERARATSALLNHHDGITGTSRQLVVDDYLARLADANMAATTAHAHSAAWWLTNGTVPGPTLREASAAAPVTDLVDATVARPVPIILTNPLGHAVTAADPIRVALAAADAARVRVLDADGAPVLAQVSSVDATSVDVWFVRTLPALSLVYVVAPRCTHGPLPNMACCMHVCMYVCIYGGGALQHVWDVLGWAVGVDGGGGASRGAPAVHTWRRRPTRRGAGQ